MAHFYGKVRGSKGEATRCGTRNSGMKTYCAAWGGAIRCRAYVNEEGIDCVTVVKTFWRGRGEAKLLYDGPIGEGEA